MDVLLFLGTLQNVIKLNLERKITLIGQLKKPGYQVPRVTENAASYSVFHFTGRGICVLEGILKKRSNHFSYNSQKRKMALGQTDAYQFS